METEPRVWLEVALKLGSTQLPLSMAVDEYGHATLVTGEPGYEYTTYLNPDQVSELLSLLTIVRSCMVPIEDAIAPTEGN
jgi:hypothetical protein